MRSEFRSALVLLVALHVLLGIVYPVAVTGLAQALWPGKANGSLIVVDGKDIG
jgi:K+-transporting ATPase ATPase C chain